MEKNAKDNSMTEKMREKKKYLYALVLVLIFILAFLGYRNGYRFGEKFLIGKIGTVEAVIPFPETTIYIDESKKITTSKDNEKVEMKLSPKTHSFIISKQGYLPWKKDISVTGSAIKILSPIFVSVNPSGVIITKTDPEYYKIRNSIISKALPSKSSPTYSKDKTVTVWLENNAIMTKQASTTSMVIQPENAIENVDFYKNSKNYLIFSMYDGVYVIEIDKIGTQNFMPIYKGKKPNFVLADANSIYIEDNGTLMQVGI